MLPVWINFKVLTVQSLKAMRLSVAIAAVMNITGCASSVKKVVSEDQPTMEQIYNAYAGGDDQAAFEMRKRELQHRDTISMSGTAMVGFPPSVNQLKHLYPRLPNPELFMYVRPHAVGETGAPVPAYLTRFTMYEREQYALPGETVETIRRNSVVTEAIAAEEREKVIAEAELQLRKKDREQMQLNKLRSPTR